MSFKILYIEDLDPGTIISEFKTCGINAVPYQPINFDATILEMVKTEYDAIVLDFRLTKGSKNVIFDAPTLAQTIRTKNTQNHRFSPIFLISNEKIISTYYKDFTSHDLFDYSNSKEWFLQNVGNFCTKLNSFIEAYKNIEKSDFDLLKILDANSKQAQFIDFRINENLRSDFYNKDTFAVSSYVYNKIIKSFNFLIGEDMLAARLGVDKKSPGWQGLLTVLDEFKYTGIFCNSHKRWWFENILEWWKSKSSLSTSLRRLTAKQRCEELMNITEIKDLHPVEKLKFSRGENFWTICKDKRVALDPIDGLELIQKDLLPWQEKEYISILSGLESSPLYAQVKPSDKIKVAEAEKRTK